MTSPLNVLCVFGTRPDAIKMAPVVKAFKQNPDIFHPKVLVTGQHREQLDQVLHAFNIVPDYDLGIMQHGQTLTQITTRVLDGLEKVLSIERVSALLAQGDTTTTFAAALAAFYRKIPFGHVEAGLRTDNIYNPFPEEMNRRLAGVIATFHFAPTDQARDNLLRENIPANRIWLTGNTGIDALHSIASTEFDTDEEPLHSILHSRSRLVLITAHRRENWGEPLENICNAIADLAREFSDCIFVYAMHKNPVVRKTAQTILGDMERVSLIEPPEYVPFVKLMQRSYLILTDSGGVQEEAPSFKVPTLVLRTTTERPEGIDAGAAKLVGVYRERIVSEARILLNDMTKHNMMSCSANPYGDGKAAEKIRSVLQRELFNDGA